MENLSQLSSPADGHAAEGHGDALARPRETRRLTRGVARLFLDMGLAVIPEFRLPTGRRADLAGLDAKGRFIIAEIKSCEADFDADAKWGDYLDYCDAFYFAVPERFPTARLPADEGLIVADGFGAAVMRAAQPRSRAGLRRRAANR